MDQMKIGSFLKVLRNERHLTQEQLAETVGVTRRTISRWETGESFPDMDILLDLADIFDCSVDALINGGHCVGTYRRRVTVAQMREAMECIHRMHDLMGPDNEIYRTMVSALDARMNSEIEPAFSNPRLMDAYICEALLSCVRDCNDWVDLHDVQVNIDAEKPRAYTIRRLKELGMK